MTSPHRPASPAPSAGPQPARTAPPDRRGPEPGPPSPATPPSSGPAAKAGSDDLIERDDRFHAVDARLSIPLFGRRYYLVILAGAELRNAERRNRDRRRHPLLTLGNVLFLAALVAMVYAMGLVAMVFFENMLTPPV